MLGGYNLPLEFGTKPFECEMEMGKNQLTET